MTVPREAIPFSTDDVSALAKSLRAQLASRATPPSHMEMLNMLARATGHRNFQHLRAHGVREGSDRRVPPERGPRSAPPQAVPGIVLRAARHFDGQGRLQSWPARRSLQDLCLWGVWSRIPHEQSFDERRISAVLGTLHLFGDPAIIRRTMCNLGLMARTPDGRDYRRIERPPSPDGAALIRHLGERSH